LKPFVIQSSDENFSSLFVTFYSNYKCARSLFFVYLEARTSAERSNSWSQRRWGSDKVQFTPLAPNETQSYQIQRNGRRRKDERRKGVICSLTDGQRRI
jgi:hypothetical protein